MATFKVRAEKIGEFVSVYQNEALPLIRKAHGHVSAFILQKEDEENHFMACTVWQTKMDAQNYDSSGQAGEVVNKIRFAFDGPPSLTTHETYGI